MLSSQIWWKFFGAHSLFHAEYQAYHPWLKFSCMLFEYKTAYVPQEQDNRSYWFVTLEHWNFPFLVSITLHIFMVNPTYPHQNYRDPNKVVGEPLISKWCSQQGLSNIWLLHDNCNEVCFLLCVWLFTYLFNLLVFELVSPCVVRLWENPSLRAFQLMKLETTHVSMLHLEQLGKAL